MRIHEHQLKAPSPLTAPEVGVGSGEGLSPHHHSSLIPPSRTDLDECDYASYNAEEGRKEAGGEGKTTHDLGREIIVFALREFE